MILREANIDDCESYFNWANDKIVRKNAFNSGVIEWQEHQKWFNNKLQDDNSYLYVVEVCKHKVGQVRFDCTNETAIIDYSIASNNRGKGFGRQSIQEAIKKIKKRCLDVKKIEAIVKIDNIASNKIFLGLGFNILQKTRKIITYNLTL